MASAMATIANVGIWYRPHFVEKVETLSGEVLYEVEIGEGERRVSEKVATNLLDAMAPIAAYSNYNNLAGGRPSAAKTGTTQLGDTGYNKDAWMLGATPQLSTAVWVGTVENTPLFNEWGGNMYGSLAPSVIWKDTMDSALADADIEEFPTARTLGYGNAPAPQQYWAPSAPAVSGDGAATDSEAPADNGAETPEAPAEGEPEAPAPEAPADNGGDIELAPGIVIPGDLFNLG